MPYARNTFESSCCNEKENHDSTSNVNIRMCDMNAVQYHYVDARAKKIKQEYTVLVYLCPEF